MVPILGMAVILGMATILQEFLIYQKEWKLPILDLLVPRRWASGPENGKWLLEGDSYWSGMKSYSYKYWLFSGELKQNDGLYF